MHTKLFQRVFQFSYFLPKTLAMKYFEANSLRLIKRMQSHCAKQLKPSLSHFCRENKGQLNIFLHKPLLANTCNNTEQRCRNFSSEIAQKITNEPVTVEHIKAVRNNNIYIMAKILGVEPEDIRRAPYKAIDEQRARRTVERLLKFGFSLGSVQLYPELLFMDAGPVENYIRIMKEAGFPVIQEQYITKFRGVINRSIPTLQNDGKMPKLAIVVEQFCDELQVDKAFRDRFIDNIPKVLDRVTLFDLRRQLIASYYTKVSLCSSEEIYQRLFVKCPRLNYRCLNWIRRTYELMTKEIGFTNERLQNHPYLLHADPDNVSRILSIPSLVGIPIKSLCHMRPRILMSQEEALRDKENAFKEHKIPFESIQKHPELLTLSPVTIRKRLEEIDNTPEFRLLKLHPRISRLLYYHTKAKERLSDFREMQLLTPSIHLLSQDKSKFEKTKSAGDVRVRGVDVIICLSEMLQIDRKSVRQSLMRHPHWLHVPIVNVKESLGYIRGLHDFSVQQLIEAIPLMLYPKDKIEQGVKDVLSSGEAGLSDDYFLSMVMYFVERETHFSGDAVWPDKMIRHDDPEEANEDQEDEDHDDAEVGKV